MRFFKSLCPRCTGHRFGNEQYNFHQKPSGSLDLLVLMLEYSKVCFRGIRTDLTVKFQK